MGGTRMGGTGMGGTGTAPSRRWSRGPVPRSPWGQKMLGCAGHRGPKGLKQASGGAFHRALLTLAGHLVQFRVNFVPLCFPKSSRRIFGHSAPPAVPWGHAVQTSGPSPAHPSRWHSTLARRSGGRASSRKAAPAAFGLISNQKKISNTGAGASRGGATTPTTSLPSLGGRGGQTFVLEPPRAALAQLQGKMFPAREQRKALLSPTARPCKQGFPPRHQQRGIVSRGRGAAWPRATASQRGKSFPRASPAPESWS